MPIGLLLVQPNKFPPTAFSLLCFRLSGGSGAGRGDRKFFQSGRWNPPSASPTLGLGSNERRRRITAKVRLASPPSGDGAKDKPGPTGLAGAEETPEELERKQGPKGGRRDRASASAHTRPEEKERRGRKGSRKALRLFLPPCRLVALVARDSEKRLASRADEQGYRVAQGLRYPPTRLWRLTTDVGADGDNGDGMGWRGREEEEFFKFHIVW